MIETIKALLPSRDSFVWILGILSGIVIYLGANPPFMEWGYYQWIAGLGFLITTVSAQMSASKLRGAK